MRGGYIFLFVSCIALAEGNAQVRDSSLTWSLQQCLQYASAHNIQVNTLRLNEEAAQQDLYVAKGIKIPGLSASVGNTFNNANNETPNDGHLVNQVSSSGSYSLNSSIVLWNYGYVNNHIKQRELLSKSAGLAVMQSQNDITLQITQAYLEILLAKENLKYITDLVSTSEARVKQGQQFYDVGSIARKDLLQLQAQLAGDRYLEVQVQNAIRQNTLTLKQILQLATDVSFDIVTPASIDLKSEMPLLKTVQQNALQNFPEIKIGELKVGVAELDIAKYRAGFRPQLSANGSLGSGYYDVITNAVSPKTAYFRQTANNFYQRVGVTLSIPIFSNRVNKSNLAKAGIAYRQAYLNLRNDQLVLSQAVERSYLNVVNARQAYEAAGQQLQFATESYRIANEQSKLGAINAYDLLQQRNQYVQAVQSYTQAKYAAALYQKIYEFYMGSPVTL